jgi:hypothetical protein
VIARGPYPHGFPENPHMPSDDIICIITVKASPHIISENLTFPFFVRAMYRHYQ